MYRWVRTTYRIGPQVKKWCRQLAEQALPSTDGSFDFKKLWDEAGEVVSKPDAVHIAKAVAEIGWDLYRRIRDQLARRKAVSVLAASEVFESSIGGQKVDVEVTTVFEVDPSAGTVAFLFFDTCTPSVQDASNDPTARERWR
jgi:hypothetical protein